MRCVFARLQLSFEHPGLAVEPKVSHSAVANAKRKARNEKKAGAGPKKKPKLEPEVKEAMDRQNAERGPALDLKVCGGGMV